MAFRKSFTGSGSSSLVLFLKKSSTVTDNRLRTHCRVARIHKSATILLVALGSSAVIVAQHL